MRAAIIAGATNFLAASRAEYDRLTEQSPSIDDAVIAQFRTRFANYDGQVAILTPMMTSARLAKVAVVTIMVLATTCSRRHLVLV